MPLPQFLSLNPVARKRLRRFRQLRRAWLSLWLLAGLYAVLNDTVMPTVTQRIQEMFNYAG